MNTYLLTRYSNPGHPERAQIVVATSFTVVEGFAFFYGEPSEADTSDVFIDRILLCAYGDVLAVELQP